MRAHAGRIADESLPLTRIRVDPFVIDPRRLYRHRTRGGQHVTLLVITVAHHKPSAVVVDLINELIHICCDLGGQRRRQHPPSAVADNLIQQRATRTCIVVGRLSIMNYREHGRTFQNQRANANPWPDNSDFRSSSGRCAHPRRLAEAHPQVLIIALREIMAELVDRASSVVQHYGGTVDKFTGDGIMAVFGAPVALEDHAVRGCLAALDIQEQVEDVQLRIGLIPAR